MEGNLALWQRNYYGPEPILYSIYTKAEPVIKNSRALKLADQLEFLGWDKTANITSLYFKPLKKMSENYMLELNDQLYNFGYGFYPTSDWQSGQIIKINFYNLPEIKQARVLSINGGYELTGIGSVASAVDSINVLGEFNLQ
jgi:hypothetical protein